MRNLALHTRMWATRTWQRGLSTVGKVKSLKTLELKIPPPAVALLLFGGMRAIAAVAPAIELPAFIQLGAAAAIAGAGAVVSLTGILTFRHARTTLNPMKPEESSALVCSGIYRVTRNPMYLGLLMALLGWAIFLSCLWTLLGPLIFVVYMNRFQIVPEERVLAGIFGSDYLAYKAKVRRWL